MVEIWDTVQVTEGIEGRYMGYHLPGQLRGLREHHKLPCRVWDRAPAENGFGTFWAQMNASDDNELGLDIRPSKWSTASCTLHYIQSRTKSRQDSEFGTIQHPKRPHNFPRIGGQNLGLDCPKKLGRMVTLYLLNKYSE